MTIKHPEAVNQSLSTSSKMWIMVAGPYRSGSRDPEVWLTNLREMNRIAYQVFLKGHVPVIAVNMVLPIIEAMGEEVYEQLTLPDLKVRGFLIQRVHLD